MADVTLPQLGETVTEGTITQWFKQVGDTVAADEALFEVSTDKVDTEVPSPVAGTLTEIRVPEGETVDVGTVIAVVGDGDGAAPAEAAPTEDAEEPPTEEAPAEDAEPAAAEPPAEAEAPQAEGEGEGTPSASGTLETLEPTPADEEGTEPATGAAVAPAEPAAAAPPSTDGAGAGAAKLLSPVVRRLVTEHGLDPAQITGSGPGGRITRDDVLDHIDATGSQPQAAPAEAAPPEQPAEQPAEQAPAAKRDAAPAPTRTPPAAAPTVASGERDRTVPLSRIRKATGAHMLMSKSVSPHAFSVVEVDYANVDRTRGEIKGDWKRDEGFGLTYLPFISRATIDALAEFPHLNASVAENELVVHGFVDLGIAVDLDYEGLIVPVIREADGKRLRAIAREIHDLADRARTKKLKPDEISGGTFTISNNGSAGSVLTMPVINQPQVAILSTDAIARKPVVVASDDGGEAIAIHPVGNLAMAWDHRAFDGAYAAGFLRRIKEILETKDWSEEV
jgi:2-oxoglutarate dehydrogenase E2 component (dihydrolipoamide succinyltransferase)